MKKLALLTTMIICCTIATWAQNGLSFTIYPRSTGTFTIQYSTYNAPSTNAMQVDWGDGVLKINNAKSQTGTNPSLEMVGNVISNRAIKIYSDCIDAIIIVDKVLSFRCESNNPQLQYIYYHHNDLNPIDLEAFYSTLKDRGGKNWGELHLANDLSSIATPTTSFLKTNAFMALDKHWYICSTKAYSGSLKDRTHYYLDEGTAKSYLMPAITLQAPTTANITDLQLGIKQSGQLPWVISASTVRIDDGTSNLKSVNVSSYSTNTDFVNNAPKLTVKGMGAEKIKIYGAMVSHIRTTTGKLTNNIDFSNTTNLRYFYTANNEMLAYVWGLKNQTLLEEFHLKWMKGLYTFYDMENLTKLKVLDVEGCSSITQLFFNTTSIESLNFMDCSSLTPYNITLFPAPNFKYINASGMGWDACDMDVFYSRLTNNPASGAEVWVNNEYASGNQNDASGSNKIIANSKGWKVWEGGISSDRELTGNGGGCKTGISEVEAAQFITLYPNPASDIVKVTIQQNLNAESLQVLDITGKTIHSMPISSSQFEYQINVSTYDKGLYLIRIGNITRKLFVK